MSQDLAPRLDSAGSTPAVASVQDILEAWLAGRNPRTLKAYRFDLADFARSSGAPSPAAAVDALLAGSAGLANRVALAYRADLLRRGLAPATVGRRLSALRSLVKLARQLGKVAWTIDVESPKTVPYRDTAGPGRSGWAAIHSRAKERAQGCTRTAEAKRNLALLRLLHDLALRRGEAVGLDLTDVELDWQGPEGTGRVGIIGKGRTEREWITLNDRTRAALADWIAIRGSAPGPLFHRLDNAAGEAEFTRLTGDSVNRMVRRAGLLAGLERPVRAHGLRHQSITRALDVTDGDVSKVKRFSRHARYETLARYDDNRTDEAGRIARLLGADD